MSLPRFESDDSCRHIGRDQTHWSVSAHRQDVPRKGRAGADNFNFVAKALAERVAAEAGCFERRWLRLLGRHPFGFFLCHWRRTFVLRESSVRVGHNCSRAVPNFPPVFPAKISRNLVRRPSHEIESPTFQKTSTFQKARTFQKHPLHKLKKGASVTYVDRPGRTD